MDILEASENGNTETVKLLLDNGADPNTVNSRGTSILATASWRSNSTSNLETVKLLLDYNANPNLANSQGITSLMLASHNSNSTSNINTVKLLLDYNADPFIKNIYNKLALDVCSTNECKTIISNAMFNQMYTNDKLLANQYSKTGDMKLPKEVWELILLRRRQQQLCKELSSNKNKNLLIAFADMLEIPISSDITKRQLCGLISEQLVWGGKYSLDSDKFTGKRYSDLKHTVTKLAYQYGIDTNQSLDKILNDISLILRL